MSKQKNLFVGYSSNSFKNVTVTVPVPGTVSYQYRQCECEINWNCGNGLFFSQKYDTHPKQDTLSFFSCSSDFYFWFNVVLVVNPCIWFCEFFLKSTFIKWWHIKRDIVKLFQECSSRIPSFSHPSMMSLMNH